jgi:NADP-dependent 3-hydroxy acid dehydrogenase YdfG
MSSLEGYVAAVTGASSGIGAAVARKLVGQGAKVVLGARRIDRLDAIVRELGASATAVSMDVTVPADAAKIVSAAVSRFGRLDGLIANAGIGMYGGILDHSDDDLELMMETNIAGTVWPVRAAVRQLREQGDGGDLIIVSSVAGLSARANEAVYAATKHAQMGLAEGLDRELHRESIRVTAMCPGGVVTEFAMREGAGRTAQSPQLADMMQADHVASAIVSVLEQPREMRTLVYSLRGLTEEN